MPKITEENVEHARRLLKGKKVFTFDQVTSLLNCSTRAARAKLKQWKAISSYNRNGGYYALPGVPRFDENGLWHYRQIHFSRYGTLRKTVVALVNKSESGLSGKQIGEMVSLSARSFLHHLRDARGMRREKHGGVFIYFSDDPDRYKQQFENRLAELAADSGPISDAEAVMILAALIKRQGIAVDEILALPEIKNRKISPLAISQFMENHGLVKKTSAAKR